jgi:hypothetical protein
MLNRTERYLRIGLYSLYQFDAMGRLMQVWGLGLELDSHTSGIEKNSPQMQKICHIAACFGEGDAGAECMGKMIGE